MKKSILLLLVLIFAGSLNAQHDRFKMEHKYKFLHIEKPALQISYGPSIIKLDGYRQDFDNASLLDIKIGFATKKSKRYFNDKLQRFDFAYFNIASYSTDLELREKTAGNIKANNWKFGFGRNSGYIISAGGLGILPYTSSAMTWTNSDWDGINSAVTSIENDKLLVFGKQFRFGGTYESGISFQVSELLSFDLNYERNNVYPRHLFWKQSGSMLLQEIGAGMIDQFVYRVLKNNPIAGSIVNFVLKSAYYFGFYELKAKEMNWPFSGDASLNYSTFKFVTGFTF